MPASVPVWSKYPLSLPFLCRTLFWSKGTQRGSTRHSLSGPHRAQSKGTTIVNCLLGAKSDPLELPCSSSFNIALILKTHSLNPTRKFGFRKCQMNWVYLVWVDLTKEKENKQTALHNTMSVNSWLSLSSDKRITRAVPSRSNAKQDATGLAPLLTQARLCFLQS